MLKGISPLFSPELLATPSRVGNETVLADARETFNNQIIRANGLKIADLLAAILRLFELDSCIECPLVVITPFEGGKPDPKVEEGYLKSIHETNPKIAPIQRLARFDFYERTKKAFAAIMTGETAKYGNIILKKGVTPVNYSMNLI